MQSKILSEKCRKMLDKKGLRLTGNVTASNIIDHVLPKDLSYKGDLFHFQDTSIDNTFTYGYYSYQTCRWLTIYSGTDQMKVIFSLLMTLLSDAPELIFGEEYKKKAQSVKTETVKPNRQKHFKGHPLA